MKIIFEFDSSQDIEDFEIFKQSRKMFAVLCDLQDELRTLCKHGTPTKRDEFWKQRLNELLEERRVVLE